ncbi:tetratricopeptide repeat protein [candidate division KSB3 bacterium]|uniref:Tetratricopeptide repeat protein n=1 Tax=candidate division KSB3 bacterium TaxID=2044937 RepID=A0A9D5JX19_9BACT|nr:tetratricopeptide repeat protein [candidate division KSB3 bacterium]MBD3325670.1 tetratricopeptide repeat protein [candidate division KSB3 bacterium]
MKHYGVHVAIMVIIGGSLLSCAREEKLGPLLQGRALEEQGEYLEAWEHYGEMDNPGFRQICRDNLRYLYGDILDAMAALQETPESADRYFDLGYAYYEKSLDVPADEDVTSNMGFDAMTYFAQQHDRFQSDAMTALQSATRLQPDHTDTLFLKALLYEEQDQTDNAILVYQALLELEVDSPMVMYRLGLLLYDQGQPERGLELAHKAVEQYPGQSGTHFALGVLYGKEGNQARALEAFHHALCADPGAIEAYYRIAQFFLQDNNFIDAARVLRLGVQTNPDALQLRLFYNGVRAILDAKEEQEARAIFQQIEGEILRDAAGAVDITEQTPRLQRRYLRLRLRLIQRQQPYHLPCAPEEPHPYFTVQIKRTQAKIDQLDQRLPSAEERR